ncbi:flagellar basal-body MS-ring/collar protein FliF [Rhizobium alvei]|uniref:Flagellar M-ring protein n=1 Tax=Rhizobium alvei TaxID=1132659 RepID=A0ABT8YFY8_9HYPH|nr:flagellar basal-body MS-ring/collar protein FliF [Rhizobium alvei]MDO6962546.1 flagellar basal-body MS-ring/collar protein FliF [Rhizobium alvei]
MNLLNQLTAILKNLSNLGMARLTALGAIGLLIVGLVLGGAYYVNRPSFETLYVGLETSDLNQISMALSSGGIDFEVGADGKSIQVPVGQTGKTRLFLAERGLPSSTNAGYELFDNVGSLGLTSFMQEVTRVRALEGEIARTIQTIDGINAARVHIVMADRGSFRQAEQKPSASVMIRASQTTGRQAASSIRHLVAAAVPGLAIDDVTILDSAGQLLASGDDPTNSNLNRSLNIAQNVQLELENNIDKALAPFLGMDNFRASVTAKLNTDAQQVQETIYDPESKVERSVRVTKENQKSEQVSADQAATVEQNVPQGTPEGGAGPKSTDQNDKKEEQTNYEINSKTVATVRNGYTVEKLSVAVVVNEDRVRKLVGEPFDQAKYDAIIAEMQKIVTTAAGLDSTRGDVVNVSSVAFMENQLLQDSVAGDSFIDIFMRNMGSMINALAFVVVAFLIVWMGFRPLIKAIGGPEMAAAGMGAPGALPLGETAGLELPDFSPPAMGEGGGGALMEGFGSDFGFDSADDLLTMNDDGSMAKKVKEGPERRLQRMVDISEERAAKILRKWAAGEEAA